MHEIWYNKNKYHKQTQSQRMNLWLLGGKNGGKGWGIWDQHVHTAIFKMNNQMNLEPIIQSEVRKRKTNIVY